jgi:hypothetical protein
LLAVAGIPEYSESKGWIWTSQRASW